MYQARPYGRFAEQVELSSEDAAAVELLARRLTDYRQASNLDAMKMVRTLPSGRQAVAVDAGGVFRIMILEPHEIPQYTFDGVATPDHIPMLFSGAITKAMVRQDIGERVELRLTEQARRRIGGYRDEALPAARQALERFVIEYGTDFKYFEPEIKGVYTFTQYLRHRPTWYSGAMAQVMQVIGGYGRQDFENLPENAVERARMLLPERWMREIRQQLGNRRLPGYTGLVDPEGKFHYDYKHSKTDAVAFDASNQPWLVQIDPGGVYAMPLPLVPATTTAAFRAYVEERNDTELLTLLDRFGGLPTGEPMPPAGAAREAWRRAGAIIKVCDASDFYTDKQAYFDACGWSLNSTGSEGYNTCFGHDGSNLKRGYAYKLRLQLQPAEDQGSLPQSWDLDDPEDARRLDAYLSFLYQGLRENGPRELAIKYKIRRAEVGLILERPVGNLSAEVDYWDNLELPPIAPHSGSISRVAEGPIYWGNPSPLSNGRLKFPALSGEGCESFLLYSEEYNGGLVRCDTIVFGCYVEDQLQVIKYFIDERTFYKEEESTYEDCMIVGSWEKTETSGAVGLMGHFYTTSFDDRGESPPTVTHTRITGRDLGYGQPAYKTPGVLFAVGGVSRARYYSRVTKINTTRGFSLDVAVCVPVYGRDAILYAYSESIAGRSESESGSRGAMADPTSYELWTYDPIFHYMGTTDSGNKGFPRPRTGDYVYVDTMHYLPTQCSDFADSGNWLGLPVGGFLDVSGICAPYTDRVTGAHHAAGVVIGGEAPGYQPYEWSQSYPGESSGRVSISMQGAANVRVHDRIPDAWYYQFSPVDAGGSLSYFYRDVSAVTIGSAEYSSVSEKGADGLRRRWGHTDLADHATAQYFIGVINE